MSIHDINPKGFYRSGSIPVSGVKKIEALGEIEMASISIYS